MSLLIDKNYQYKRLKIYSYRETDSYVKGLVATVVLKVF